ncbi:MAG: hypothetical protein HKN56_02935 [Gammaproteobacteria bacterium]|nr:hypothetical protein [Gammaproteobacteria bacterium]
MNLRLEELLIDQAVFGLDAGEEAELAQLLQEHPEAAENPFLETTALVQLGLAATDPQGAVAMPADLRRKLAATAPHDNSNSNPSG